MSDYDFHERLRATEEVLLARLGGVERVLAILSLRLNPIRGIRKASLADDLAGVDYWADRPEGHALGIDIKCRERDFGDDLLIEFVSNTKTNAPGWTVKEHSKTDFVLYLWPERHVLISYPQLRAATLERLPDWVDQFPEKANITTTDGGRYQTRWIAVPDGEVYRALGYRVSGPLVPTTTAASGPTCPECHEAPLAATPELFDPRIVTYRCSKRHEWQAA